MFHNADKQGLCPSSVTGSTVECYTPAQRIPQEYRVRVGIDEAVRDASSHFTYREDPVVLKIHPAKSFLRWVKVSYRNKGSNEWKKNGYTAQQSVKRNCIFISICHANCFYYGAVAEGRSFPFRGEGEGGRAPLFFRWFNSYLLLSIPVVSCWDTCSTAVSPVLHLDITLICEENHLMWQVSSTQESKWILK